MQAIEAGGVPVAYDPDRDSMLQDLGRADYAPNPNGYYELLHTEWYRADLITAYDGKAVKLFLPALSRYRDANVPVFYMRRKYDAVKASQVKTFGENAHVNGFTKEYFDRQIQGQIAYISRFHDVTVVDYEDLVASPQAIIEAAAIPGVDPASAATAIDPGLRRNE
jgi:hypothetical protein